MDCRHKLRLVQLLLCVVRSFAMDHGHRRQGRILLARLTPSNLTCVTCEPWNASNTKSKTASISTLRGMQPVDKCIPKLRGDVQRLLGIRTPPRDHGVHVLETISTYTQTTSLATIIYSRAPHPPPAVAHLCSKNVSAHTCYRSRTKYAPCPSSIFHYPLITFAFGQHRNRG